MSVSAPRIAGASLRPATLRDVPAIHALIAGFAERGLMLPRSIGELSRHFREYAVVTGPDGELRGCGGLRVHTPASAEVVGLAVDRDHRGKGYGRRLVEALVAEARGRGIGTVFAMTLEPGFFHGLGFATVSRARFPEKIRADCIGCPRRAGCSEVAVALELADAHGAEEETDGGRGPARGPALRVLRR